MKTNKTIAEKKDKCYFSSFKKNYILPVAFLGVGAVASLVNSAFGATVNDLYFKAMNYATENYEVTFPEANDTEGNCIYLSGTKIDGLIPNSDNFVCINLVYPNEIKSLQELEEINVLNTVYGSSSRLEVTVTGTIEDAVKGVANTLGWKLRTEPENPQNPQTPNGFYNFPNPFNGNTKLKYNPNSEISIYSITGELVTQLKTDSSGYANWDGTNNEGEQISSGVYFGLAGKNKIKIVRVK